MNTKQGILKIIKLLEPNQTEVLERELKFIRYVNRLQSLKKGQRISKVSYK